LGETRTLFKELLRVKPLPKFVPARASATRAHRASARFSGRSVLYALLRFVQTLQARNQDPLLPQLTVTIRRFFKRNSLPAVSAIRLLLLKTAAISVVATDPVKKGQLLNLGRH
jgi:hypothetical protein